MAPSPLQGRLEGAKPGTARPRGGLPHRGLPKAARIRPPAPKKAVRPLEGAQRDTLPDRKGRAGGWTPALTPQQRAMPTRQHHCHNPVRRQKGITRPLQSPPLHGGPGPRHDSDVSTASTREAPREDRVRLPALPRLY